MTIAIPATVRAQATTWYLNPAVTYLGSNTQSVWASSSNDIWLAGGFKNLQHYDGTGWSMPSQPATFNRYTVFGFGPGQVFSTGQNGYTTGAIHSCTTSTCTTIYTAETELIGLWGRSASDLYVSGDGIIRRFNGSTWTDIATGLSTQFNLDRLESISGGATRTFIVGRNGRILSYDGSALTHMTSGTLAGLNGVSAVNDNLAFAVGGAGTILQFDGSAWLPMASNTTQDLFGVYALSATSAYATGNNGTVLYWNGSTWSMVDIGTGGFLGTPFALSESRVYIPRANGQFGELISSDASLGGRVLVTSTVPEPATVMMLASGLGVLLVVGRRRIERRT